jgi:cell pole-organizing protein PopZ
LAWSAREPDRSFGSPPADESADFPQPASLAHEPEAEPDDEAPADILDLADQMAAEPPRPPGFRTIDVSDLDVVFAERAAAARSPAAVPPVAAEPPAAPTTLRPAAERRDHAPPRNEAAPARGEPTLVSAATSAAVDSAFNTLAQTVLVQNGRTLEDLVREMLRPLLKSWLDDNLPGLVERLVRAEIERVSRGRP